MGAGWLVGLVWGLIPTLKLRHKSGVQEVSAPPLALTARPWVQLRRETITIHYPSSTHLSLSIFFFIPYIFFYSTVTITPW